MLVLRKLYASMLSLFVLVALALMAPVSAHAQLVVPTIDTTDFLAVAGAVLVAVALFYGIRKALALLGR